MAVGEKDPHYWLGYLAASLKVIARDAAGTRVAREAERVVAEFESRPTEHRQTVAFAVVDALGECYAIRGTRDEANAALAAASDHLTEALGSGHVAAAKWVAEREPFGLLTITEEERIEMLEEGTPVLDREP